MRGQPRIAGEAGFTLVEVLVSMTVLLVGVVGALSLIDRANATTVATKSREAGTSLARELIETTRTIPYDRLTATNLLTELAAQPGLADTVPGGQYSLVRRDVVFNVSGTVCVMDDPRDGGGDQTGGGFCSGSAGLSTPADRNPEDYKRATITVTWERDGVSRSVTQTGTANNPGAAGAPSVRAITATHVASHTMRIDIGTGSPAANVNWLLDGMVRSPAPTGDASGVSWTADWDLTSVLDGTYVVGAEAFDVHGVSGPGRQLTVQINRNAPSAPTGATGGRNRYGDVEVEWAASRERDIVGYAVTLSDGRVICSLEAIKMATECRDPDPPPVSAGPAYYRVVAYDRDANGVLRAGAHVEVTVIADNVAPSAPENVRAGAGEATLTWNRPALADAGPADDTISYYRIYRDGKAYSDRYARWFDDGSAVSWSDPDPDGMTHTYWVTSVDTHYLESEFVGGVMVG